jgi:hypothetical protein
MKERKMNQAGLSAIGLIIILLIIAFITMAALKLAPIYYENFKVNSVIKSLNEEQGITDMSHMEINTLISRRFIIDNIDRVKPKDIKVAYGKNRLLINVDYEIRENFFANVDIVVVFNDKYEITGR